MCISMPTLTTAMTPLHGTLLLFGLLFIMMIYGAKSTISVVCECLCSTACNKRANDSAQ